MNVIGTGIIDFSGGPFTYSWSKPDWSSPGVNSLYNETKVEIIGKTNGWYEVNSTQGPVWVTASRINIYLNIPVHQPKPFKKPTQSISVTTLNETGIVSFSGGPFTYSTRNPNWNNDGICALNNGEDIAWVVANRVNTSNLCIVKNVNMNVEVKNITKLNKLETNNNQSKKVDINKSEKSQVKQTKKLVNKQEVRDNKIKEILVDSTKENYNKINKDIDKTEITNEVKIFKEDKYGFVNSKGSSNIDVRLDANLTSKVMFNLYNGTKVKLLKETNNWYQIKINNKIGWVQKNNISIKSN